MHVIHHKHFKSGRYLAARNKWSTNTFQSTVLCFSFRDVFNKMWFWLWGQFNHFQLPKDLIWDQMAAVWFTWAATQSWKGLDLFTTLHRWQLFEKTQYDAGFVGRLKLKIYAVSAPKEHKSEASETILLCLCCVGSRHMKVFLCKHHGNSEWKVS